MDDTRRSFFRTALLGAGMIGLRSLASGIPASILSNPRSASADTAPACTTAPKYFILVTSGSGDPLNANVPGCYKDADVYHPGAATMTPTQMVVGGATVTAAKPWAMLPPEILNRTSFFHHATYTNGHGDAPKVNRLMGAVKRQEMLASLIAKSLSGCMTTVQAQPAVLSNTLVTYAGSVLPVLSPQNLQAVLGSPKGPLTDLQALRDADVNRLNALYKSTGNQAQKAALDKYALSQTAARNLSGTLLQDLTQIGGSGRTDQNTAAAILIKMNVTPAIVMNYSFGGDNHNDMGLANEASETVASTEAIKDLILKLTKYDIQDRVTIAFQNVFGRTLHQKSHMDQTNGRNHNASHHCTVLIGSSIKSSLIGGIKLNNGGNDFRSTGIDSATGASNDAGDIPYDSTLGAVGKTIAAACGVTQSVIDDQITLGKVVPAALA